MYLFEIIQDAKYCFAFNIYLKLFLFKNLPISENYCYLSKYIIITETQAFSNQSTEFRQNALKTFRVVYRTIVLLFINKLDSPNPYEQNRTKRRVPISRVDIVRALYRLSTLIGRCRLPIIIFQLFALHRISTTRSSSSHRPFFRPQRENAKVIFVFRRKITLPVRCQKIVLRDVISILYPIFGSTHVIREYNSICLPKCITL